MKTSAEWWATTKADDRMLRAWLLDQYRGESTAGERIDALRDQHAAPDSRAHRVLTTIATQERKHAEWVGELLAARGIVPRVEAKPTRYWVNTMKEIRDLETGCAVGAHAERMRLKRIEVIVADDAAPADVREVFRRILPEERFHARAFAELAGADAIAATRGAHDLGRQALGLAP